MLRAIAAGPGPCNGRVRGLAMAMLSLHDANRFSPCPAPFNMAAYVLRAGADDPQKVALSVLGRDGAQDWTYGALIAAVRGTATGLLEHGLRPGDTVLMRLANTVDFPIAYLGAIAAGLVPAPTSSALTEDDTAAMIARLHPKAILLDPDVPCPRSELTLTREALRTMRDRPPAEWHMGAPDRPGYIIHTSGTSGTPCAVVHAHRAIWARQMMFDGWYGLRRTDRMLHAGAFNWTYTLGTGLMDPWTIGATALIPAQGTAPADLPGLLKTHKATIFAAAPGVYRQILNHHARLDLPDLRHGLSAGEKMAPSLRAAWRTAGGPDIFEAFGMSECSTFISGCPDRPADPAALGFVQPGRHVAIVDERGPVPRDTPGTIAVHRSDPGLMLGYLDDPAQTRARFAGDWFLTGDMGVMDEIGQITYLGRDDDMMNAGGFRVSPLEVEQALAEAEGITGIAVTQIEIKPGVQVIAAFCTSDAPLDDTALRGYADTRLARYKQPRLYVHLPVLPLSANGKLMRRALRAGYKATDP